MIKSYPQPPANEKGLLEWAKKLYAALADSEVVRQEDEDYYGVRHDSTEPPDPHPGMIWLAGTSTYEGYCKVRLDVTEPTTTAPGLLWYYTSGGTAAATQVVKIRNEDNTAWRTFISAESPGSDFHCYVSDTEPGFTEEGMLWLNTDAAGMLPGASVSFTCRAYVNASAPSPTSARMAWCDT